MMKKIYLGAMALMAGLNLSAQMIDFESTVLTTNSYNNGSDLSGGFTYGGVHFTNYYDTTFNYNEGFSISNVTDNTTAGWGNQYSAITGSGNSSDNYAIFYPSGSIDFSNSPCNLGSVRITNSTYAALSMRDGDFVGKKFGSLNGADGNPDGTNGEDYLKLIFHSLTINGDTIASMDYYLADYRFADSTQDYIVDEWEYLDLSSLNGSGPVISYLIFSFESSDVGQFGINTPTYFAMDDLLYNIGNFGLAENNLKDEWEVFPNPVKSNFSIKGIEGNIKILDLSGKEMHSSDTTNELIEMVDFPNGVYFLTVENENGISTKRIVKI